MAALLFGFQQLQDILNLEAIQVDRTLLIAAVQTTVESHNTDTSTLLRTFSEDTEEYKLRWLGQNSTRNQPLDENGRSKPIKPALYYDVAWPIFSSGNAWGTNFVTNAKMTVQQLNDITSDLLMGDFRRTRDDLLASIFNSTNNGRTFTDPVYGDLAVYGMANGDTVKYITSGSDVPVVHNHYLGQAAAIDDAHNPYPTLWQTLREHPENSGEFVAFISTDLVASTSNLSTFVPISDVAIQYGANTNLVKGGSSDTGVVNSIPGLGLVLPGTCRVIGRENFTWIVEWPSLPASTIVAKATGGPAAIRRRQDKQTALQGFRPVAQRNDFPYFEDQWFRRQGFGAWNRVNIAVMIIGNANYAIPTGFDAFVP